MERIERGCEKFGDRWIMKYYGAGTGQSIHEPLHTITTKDRFALVSRIGEDVHFRMLKPDELLAAQFGRFANGYSLRAAKTHKDKVRLIGNSVCPEIVESILTAYGKRGQQCGN
jgi:DNA (cytosine-5)-methyltransferase 1